MIVEGRAMTMKASQVEGAAFGPGASNRSDELLDILSHYRSVIVVCHDYPDPDAIAAGWAIERLVSEKLRVPTRFFARGQVLRAENRYLLDLLQPPLELVHDKVDIPADAAAVLVDCDPRGSNHLLNGAAARLVAVIDHHSADVSAPNVPFQDIRQQLAATASIAAQYLREQLIVPDARLATAIIYALRTETRGGEAVFTPFDHRILTWLTGLANPTWLAQIETAPFHCTYLSDLVSALESTLIYDDTAFCFFPTECQAGLVAEVSDMLVRCQELRYVCCGAAFGRDVLISVRVDRSEMHAGQLVQRLVDGFGKGGGHQHRAGAKISGATELMASGEQLCRELRERWLALCGAEDRQATPLVQAPQGRAMIKRSETCSIGKKPQ
jgi:nanoRNase/pAp phosphatase (c-di-AMP/oligoRNAs hydrolase)